MKVITSGIIWPLYDWSTVLCFKLLPILIPSTNYCTCLNHMSVALVMKCVASYAQVYAVLPQYINSKRYFNGYKLITRQSDLVIKVSELYRGVKH